MDLSPAAVEIQSRGAIETPLWQVPPGRMKEILERLWGGFYDRPDVRDVVLRRLKSDLGPER